LGRTRKFDRAKMMEERWMLMKKLLNDPKHLGNL
jgi:hypothetical protein